MKPLFLCFLFPFLSSPLLGKADRLNQIDQEEMALVKVIHAKIFTQKNLPHFQTYTEKNGAAHFTMIPVRGASFTWQGAEKSDQLDIKLSPYWMGKYEVTWDEYEPFMLAELPRNKDGKLLDFIKKQVKGNYDLITRPTPPYHPMNFGMPTEAHPAISMTQHAANKYCQWLSFKTGHFYRLPTEAEWEYACRAGQEGDYSWGNKTYVAADYAWFKENSRTGYQKIGTKKANAWGFFDMHGNVTEWTLDQAVPNRAAYFKSKSLTDPWVRATKPYPHVTKGGHWQSNLEKLKITSRITSQPAWKASDPQEPKSIWYHTNTPWLGFRIVRPLKIPTAREMYFYWNSGVAHDQ